MWNDHSWYTLASPLDWLRAILWCAANFATFAAYFLIPWELRGWKDALPFVSVTVIGRLFIAFIALCGLSHLSMLFIMPTAPWWATVGIYVPMAVVSVITVVVLRSHREMIVRALAGVYKAMRHPP